MRPHLLGAAALLVAAVVSPVVSGPASATTVSSYCTHADYPSPTSTRPGVRFCVQLRRADGGFRAWARADDIQTDSRDATVWVYHVRLTVWRPNGTWFAIVDPDDDGRWDAWETGQTRVWACRPGYRAQATATFNWAGPDGRRHTPDVVETRRVSC